MRRVALVGCSKTKLEYPAPASRLYIGNLFKKAYDYAQKNFSEVYILSAKHGFLKTDEIIAPYNYTLKGKSKKIIISWSKQTAEIMNKFFSDDDILSFFTGEIYYKYLSRLLNCHTTLPLRGLRMGPQLRYFTA